MISIVIPAYNEEGAVTETVKSITDVLRENGYDEHEIVLVDDGSTDRTAELAEQAGARVIVNLTNSGYGRSIKRGIEAATHDTIVITDADGTYPCEEIPKLLKEYEKGYDMVIGLRTGKHYHESWLKYPLRVALRKLVEFTVGRRIPDPNSGLRVFSREAVKEYFGHLCDTFSFTTCQVMAYMLTGRFVKYVPIVYNSRVGKTKVRLFADSLRTLQYIIQCILFYNPIKLFLILCMASVGVGVVCLLLIPVIGTAAGLILLVVSVLTSLLLFALGLIARLGRGIRSYRTWTTRAEDRLDSSDGSGQAGN